MTDRLRDAARRRQDAIDAAQAASVSIEAERAERLARLRPIPKTTAEPLPEEAVTRGRSAP